MATDERATTTVYIMKDVGMTSVGCVIRSIDDGETTFQIGSHPPRGFSALVVWNVLISVAIMVVEYFVLFHLASKLGNARFAPALMFGFFLFCFLALTLDAIWWRRVCCDGTEVVLLRGNLLIHRAKAFGYAREWVRQLDKVWKVKRMAQAQGKFVATVTLWARFPNTFMVGWALDPESGEWLTAELDAAALRLRGDSHRS
jgi:hypothetical protein